MQASDAVEALARSFGVHLTEQEAPSTLDTIVTKDPEFNFSGLKYFGRFEVVMSDEYLFVTSGRCVALLSGFGHASPEEAFIALDRGTFIVGLGSDTVLWNVDEVLLCSYQPDGWFVIVRQNTKGRRHAFIFSQQPILQVSFHACQSI